MRTITIQEAETEGREDAVSDAVRVLSNAIDSGAQFLVFTIERTGDNGLRVQMTGHFTEEAAGAVYDAVGFMTHHMMAETKDPLLRSKKHKVRGEHA